MFWLAIIFSCAIWATSPTQETATDLEYLATLMPAARCQEILYYDLQAVRREIAGDEDLQRFVAGRGGLDPSSIVDELPGFRAEEISSLLIALYADQCTLQVSPLEEKTDAPKLDKGSSFLFSVNEIVLTLDDRRIKADVDSEFLAVVTLVDPTRIAQRLAKETTPVPAKPQHRKHRVFKLGGSAGSEDDVDGWICVWSPDTLLVAGKQELLERMILAGDGLTENLADSATFRKLMNHRGELGQYLDFENPQAPYLAVIDAAEKRETLRGDHLDRLRAEIEARADAYRLQYLRFGASIVEERIDVFNSEEEAGAAERLRRDTGLKPATGSAAEDAGTQLQRQEQALTTLRRDGAMLVQTFTLTPEYLQKLSSLNRAVEKNR